MRPFSLHPIATWRRRHPSHSVQRRSSVVQACADELAVIVERRLSVPND
jgi:hypothetical protein